MADEHLISIVLAAYNGEKYIRDQMESILAQTYGKMEVICVDDKSTEATPQILLAYQEKYPEKIRFHQNAQNTGSRKAFEKGVSVAKGKYIAFADQDDWWLPEKLRVLHDAIEKDPQLAFVYSNSELVDENLHTIMVKTWEDKAACLSGDAFYQILNDNTIMGCSMLVNAEFARECLPFPNAGLHHDWYLTAMALGKGRSIQFIDQVLFKYRRHAGNQVNRERKGHSQNTTRFRAIRTYKETALLDVDKFTNAAFRELIVCKRELFRNILFHHPVKAFLSWRRFYALLHGLGADNARVKRSNFRYILYGLFWRKPSEQELI